MGTLHEDLCTFLIISHSVLLRMRNVSDKSLRENQNTHFMFSNFFQTSYSFWDNMENIVEPERPHMTVWCMCISCWIPKVQTHILIICNTYCLSTATIVAGMRLSVMLYIHCMSCFSEHKTWKFRTYTILEPELRVCTFKFWDWVA